jgi:tetratricopeptide (TPR) repeat protein
MDLRRVIGCLRPVGLVVLTVLIQCGCATPALDSARYNFYAGKYDKANETLDSAKVPENNQVLFNMERGTIRLFAGRYQNSARDYIAASDQLDKLETYSVSKGTASWVVNDSVQDFRGTPYERTLLHTFTAKDHLATGNWDDAAVEARRIIKSLDPAVRGDYPEDAYSRYMAGFCLEMIDDDSNAAIQYRRASALLSGAKVDENTGHMIPAPDKPAGTNTVDVSTAPAPSNEKPWPHELVCFVLLGRSARGADIWEQNWKPGQPMYAEIYCKGERLGRSYNLADTVDLAYTTDQIEAVRKMIKTVGRVMVKEAIADSIEANNNELLGELVRFVLIGLLERPDVRRWETLPRWLQVARVPCPPDLESFDVVLKTFNGVTIRTLHIEKPIARRRNTFVSFCRDIVSAPSVVVTSPARDP